MDDHDKIEEIILEIATKHGIAVARDDPILVLQTINNRLLLDSAKAQHDMLAHYKEELEALALRWGNDAREKAERTLNASLAASKEAMGLLLDEAGKRGAARMASEIDTALSRVGAKMKDARRIAVLNVIAACITMGAAGTVLWAVLH